MYRLRVVLIIHTYANSKRYLRSAFSLRMDGDTLRRTHSIRLLFHISAHQTQNARLTQIIRIFAGEFLRVAGGVQNSCAFALEEEDLRQYENSKDERDNENSSDKSDDENSSDGSDDENSPDESDSKSDLVIKKMIVIKMMKIMLIYSC